MAQSPSYPVMLSLQSRPVLVVGGGRVAARKVRGLLESGARVHVISPALGADLAVLLAAGTEGLEWSERVYLPSDLASPRPVLVFAATDDPVVNHRVAEEAAALGILVNRLDDAAESDFTGVSSIRRGAVTVSISTDGHSPALSRFIRAQIETLLGEEVAVLAAWLGELRSQSRHNTVAQHQRQALYEQIIVSDVLTLLRAGQPELARERFDELVTQGVGA